MYQIAEYAEGSGMSTAVLLEALMNHPVERIVVGSSPAIAIR